MKFMHEISKVCRTIWLRTDRSVMPTHTADWHHLLAVQNALHRGVFAMVDMNRREFYEIEVDDMWYYIHIPSRIGGVYLIAAGRNRCARPIARNEAQLFDSCCV